MSMYNRRAAINSLFIGGLQFQNVLQNAAACLAVFVSSTEIQTLLKSDSTSEWFGTQWAWVESSQCLDSGHWTASVGTEEWQEKHPSQIFPSYNFEVSPDFKQHITQVSRDDLRRNRQCIWKQITGSPKDAQTSLGKVPVWNECIHQFFNEWISTSGLLNPILQVY